MRSRERFGGPTRGESPTTCRSTRLHPTGVWPCWAARCSCRKLDCVLVALNVATGNVLWQTKVCDTSDDYTMTGAPLIANGSVVIGVSGAEYGIRGSWLHMIRKRGNKSGGSTPSLVPASLDTTPGKMMRGDQGGGSTWVTGDYDPTLDLVYWGVGNPAPAFNGDVRPGDNLFTDCLLAINVSTGKLAWYFQFTPHDEHDWDATQTPILTDLMIKGTLRKVLCVPDRNGFYYVLDRATGEFLTGVPFVEVNWATGLDRRDDRY